MIMVAAILHDEQETSQSGEWLAQNRKGGD